MNRNRHVLAVAAALAALLAVGYGVQAGVWAQQAGEPERRQPADEAQQQEQAPAKKKMAMQCPMMAAVQGLELHADSPALVLAQADALDLTEQQKDELKKILETARRRARDVLNEEQQQELAQAPEGPLSMMQLARLRMKGDAGDSGAMCPMCMKMMQQQGGREHHPEK